MLFPAVIDPP